MNSCMQYFVAASSVYSLAFFQPIILRNGMGFSYAKAQLLSSPPYIFTVFASLAGAWVSDKIRMRWPILVGQSIVAIVGLLIVLYGGLPGVRYFGLFLATWGTQANVPASLAYGQNQTARVQKRAVVAAAMISIGAAGGVTGSTIFQTKDDLWALRLLTEHSNTCQACGLPLPCNACTQSSPSACRCT
jgi:MFS family permease